MNKPDRSELQRLLGDAKAQAEAETLDYQSIIKQLERLDAALKGEGEVAELITETEGIITRFGSGLLSPTEKAIRPDDGRAEASPVGELQNKLKELRKKGG